MSRFGPRFGPFDPAALKRLSESSPPIDRKATIVEAAQQPSTAETLAQLVAALHDPDVGLRAAVVGALGRYPTQMAGVVPALQEGMKDASPTVRHRAAMALIRVPAHAEESLAVLRADLKNSDASIRSGAARVLLETLEFWSGRIARVDRLGMTGGSQFADLDRQAVEAKAGMALLGGAIAEVVALL
ncbi:MAG: HEAT repeat domain-containing protein [Planctomycetes bacterium]|nr:HEAT repeat domain-containing protein [Planctomycetota bacterium]